MRGETTMGVIEPGGYILAVSRKGVREEDFVCWSCDQDVERIYPTSIEEAVVDYLEGFEDLPLPRKVACYGYQHMLVYRPTLAQNGDPEDTREIDDCFHDFGEVQDLAERLEKAILRNYRPWTVEAKVEVEIDAVAFFAEIWPDEAEGAKWEDPE